MGKHEVDQFVDEIRKFAATADETTCEMLTSALRTVSIELETPAETVARVLYPALQPAITRVGNNLNIFEILSTSNEPITAQKLAAEKKCDPILMSKFCQSTTEHSGFDYFIRSNSTIPVLNWIPCRNGRRHLCSQ
jgi:hypothetical protein